MRGWRVQASQTVKGGYQACGEQIQVLECVAGMSQESFQVFSDQEKKENLTGNFTEKTNRRVNTQAGRSAAIGGPRKWQNTLSRRANSLRLTVRTQADFKRKKISHSRSIPDQQTTSIRPASTSQETRRRTKQSSRSGSWNDDQPS